MVAELSTSYKRTVKKKGDAHAVLARVAVADLHEQLLALLTKQHSRVSFKREGYWMPESTAMVLTRESPIPL